MNKKCQYYWFFDAKDIEILNIKIKFPKSFEEAYPDSSFELINKDNFLDFVL